MHCRLITTKDGKTLDMIHDNEGDGENAVAIIHALAACEQAKQAKETNEILRTALKYCQQINEATLVSVDNKDK